MITRGYGIQGGGGTGETILVDMADVEFDPDSGLDLVADDDLLVVADDGMDVDDDGELTVGSDSDLEVGCE